MKFSESMAEIAAALCQFQATVTNPKKDSDNPFFKSKYADLDEIIKAIRPAMEKSGLSFIQNPAKDENGNIGVYTMLLHKSGEYIVFDPVLVPVPKKDAQGIGAAMTYARRYSLGAALGIATDEDDDANSIQEPTQRKQQQQKPVQQKQQVQTNQQQSKRDLNEWKELGGKERKRFFAIAGKKNLSEKHQKAIIYFYTDKTSRAEVTETEYQQINNVIEKATMDEINHTIQAAIDKSNEKKVS
jgi:hypothetical protein